VGGAWRGGRPGAPGAVRSGRSPAQPRAQAGAAVRSGAHLAPTWRPDSACLDRSQKFGQGIFRVAEKQDRFRVVEQSIVYA